MPKLAKLKILFAGMIASDPHQGGATWAVLQYLLGFRKLGHEVYFVEPIKQSALRPKAADLATSENAVYFRQVMRDFGFQEHAALLLADSQETVGLEYCELRSITSQADVLFNISGMLTDEALLEAIPCRVYLDLDPAFIQLWQHACNVDMRFAGHTHFATIGRTIGSADCSVPLCGINWSTTFQPVVLDQWPVADQVVHDAFTTVANWRGYGSIEHEGRHYGQKAHSLRKFFPLPKLTGERIAPALSIHPGETSDLAALAENNWQVLDPLEHTSTPARYREFIRGSKAEFAVAKSGYVVSRCGWFSDRSVCYLAAGRPVVAQETGFSDFLPVGEGLFSFETMDDALGAIEQVNRTYPEQRRAARSMAEQFFDSKKVLSSLLENTKGATTS